MNTDEMMIHVRYIGHDGNSYLTIKQLDAANVAFKERTCMYRDSRDYATTEELQRANEDWAEKMRIPLKPRNL